MKSPQRYINFLVFLIIFGFLLSYFRLELILSPTTTSGGDTGSHNYLAKYMKDYLLPNMKLTGWSPDWYAGFPAFTFYFPLPYALMAILSSFIPFEIAFKVVTILGTFLLPVSAFLAARKMKFDFPFPIIFSVLTLPFLFLENNSMYGGNIPSTLAGEFSFSISLSLALLFMAYVYEDIRQKKTSLSTILLLAVTSLVHLIPVIVAVASTAFFAFSNVKRLAKIYALSFGLAAFWAVPLLVNMGYTTSSAFTRSIRYELVFPDVLMPYFFLAALGLYFAFQSKEHRIFYFLFAAILTLTLYFVVPEGHIWNARFLPFYYLFSLPIAAYGLYKIAKRIDYELFLLILPVLLAVLSLSAITQNVTYIDHWISWNYEGFESKKDWSTLKELNAFLSSLPDGRVYHEYSNDHDRMFGTPRTLENIPYFTNKPGMEGLLIESSITSPYHFYLQSELSKTPTCPISTLICTSLDVTRALPHINLFNIKYIVATSDELKAQLNRSEFRLLKTIGTLNVYSADRESRYVTLPEYEPAVYEGRDWKDFSIQWFAEGKETPVIYTNEKTAFRKVNRPEELEKIPLNANCRVNETIKNEEILISTNCVGKPLLVKISYFPNWQAEGGKLYLASPSFMIVIPEKETLRLHYSMTPIDFLGISLSALTALFIIVALWRKPK